MGIIQGGYTNTSGGLGGVGLGCPATRGLFFDYGAFQAVHSLNLGMILNNMGDELGQGILELVVSLCAMCALVNSLTHVNETTIDCSIFFSIMKDGQ